MATVVSPPEKPAIIRAIYTLVTVCAVAVNSQATMNGRFEKISALFLPNLSIIQPTSNDPSGSEIVTRLAAKLRMGGE